MTVRRTASGLGLAMRHGDAVQLEASIEGGSGNKPAEKIVTRHIALDDVVEQRFEALLGKAGT